MRRFFLAILSAGLTVGTAVGQDSPAAPAAGSAQQQQSTAPSTSQPASQPMSQPAPQTQQSAPATTSTPTRNPAPATTVNNSAPPRIAPGSVIPVQLAKTVDAKKAKTGDEVIATVTQDMKSNNGDVLVTKDTKVVGHVTEAQPRNKEQKESQLGIVFDRTLAKTGEMQMPMSIQAIIAPPNATSASSNEPSAPTPGNSSAGTQPVPERNGNMGSQSSAANAPNAPNATPMPSSNEDSSKNARPRVTAKTEGIIGISNMTLAAAPNAAQGSLVSSEKNNVKLESGTMMLLRVSQ